MAITLGTFIKLKDGSFTGTLKTLNAADFGDLVLRETFQIARGAADESAAANSSGWSR